jgi:ZIP family zinc transporter
MNGNIIVIGLIASLLAGLGTGAGALPALFLKRVSDRALDAMLGAAAGVMLAATSFSLIIPAIEYGDAYWGGGGVIATVIGIAVGAVFLDRIDKLIPHQHFFKGAEGPSSSLKKTWLFIFAITIHNFPEGMAVGVGFGSGDVAAGTALAIGIGLQNAPEGLAVALPLLREKYSRLSAFLIATLTGLVEPVGGFLGVSLVVIFKPILPLALAFAAGAMLFVISDEIIPETHSRGNERIATFGVIIGFIIMTALDNLLG